MQTIDKLTFVYPPNVNDETQTPSSWGTLYHFWLSGNCLQHINSLALGIQSHRQDFWKFSDTFILLPSSTFEVL